MCLTSSIIQIIFDFYRIFHHQWCRDHILSCQLHSVSLEEQNQEPRIQDIFLMEVMEIQAILIWTKRPKLAKNGKNQQQKRLFGQKMAEMSLGRHRIQKQPELLSRTNTNNVNNRPNKCAIMIIIILIIIIVFIIIRELNAG